jgi:hypothetical protein
MYHTTMKKIALVLTITLGIHATTECVNWGTKEYASAILGTVTLLGGLGTTIWYFKFKEKPEEKKDLVKITSQEECSSSSQKTPQFTEDMIRNSEPEIEPTPICLPNHKLVIEEHTSNMPASVQIRTQKLEVNTVTPKVVVTQRENDFSYDKALLVGSFNDPFNN